MASCQPPLWRTVQATLRNTGVAATLQNALDSYPAALQRALRRADMPKQRLSKLMAEQTGNKPESERRAIYSYLDGTARPDPTRAELLAVILKDRQLADVPPVGRRRLDRHAELVAEVAQISRTQAEILGQLSGVLGRLERLEHQLEQPRVAPKRQRDGR